MQRTRTRNGWFAFTLMREKIFNEKNGLSSGRRRNARSSFTLLQMSLSSVAGVTPVFHYPCSQRIYLKWVAGVALCAIPTLDTPRGEANICEYFIFGEGWNSLYPRRYGRTPALHLPYAPYTEAQIKQKKAALGDLMIMM